jgi:hypothetical protein
MVLREMHSALTCQIYKTGAQQSASQAVFQLVNGCAAHLSRYLPLVDERCAPGHTCPSVSPNSQLVTFTTRILVTKSFGIACSPGYVVDFRHERVGIYRGGSPQFLTGVGFWDVRNLPVGTRGGVGRGPCACPGPCLHPRLPSQAISPKNLSV